MRGAVALGQVEQHALNGGRLLHVGQAVEAFVGREHKPQRLGCLGYGGENHALSGLHTVKDELALLVAQRFQFLQRGGLCGSHVASDVVQQQAVQLRHTVYVCLLVMHHASTGGGG